MFEEMGGKPSVTMFRRSDTTIEEPTKERYRQLIAGKIKQPVPTAGQEVANQAEADTFYDACGTWLRANTRHPKKFPLLFGENVGYGFRRNLFGLKWPALALNLIVVAICAALLWYRGALDMDNDLTMRTVVVLIVAAIHALLLLRGHKDRCQRSGPQVRSRAYPIDRSPVRFRACANSSKAKRKGEMILDSPRSAEY